jgi:hypothetical protein
MFWCWTPERFSRLWSGKWDSGIPRHHVLRDWVGQAWRLGESTMPILEKTAYSNGIAQYFFLGEYSTLLIK